MSEGRRRDEVRPNACRNSLKRVTKPAARSRGFKQLFSIDDDFSVATRADCLVKSDSANSTSANINVYHRESIPFVNMCRPQRGTILVNDPSRDRRSARAVVHMKHDKNTHALGRMEIYLRIESSGMSRSHVAIIVRYMTTLCAK